MHSSLDCTSISVLPTLGEGKMSKIKIAKNKMAKNELKQMSKVKMAKCENVEKLKYRREK